MARLNPHSESADAVESDESFEDAVTQTSKRQRLKHIGSVVKHAPKRALRRMEVIRRDDDQMDADGEEVEGITDSATFNVGKVFNRESEETTGLSARSVASKANAILHPRQRGKQKAAKSFQPAKHPFLTPQADEDLLDAHQDLTESWQGTSESGAEDDKLNRKIANVNRLERKRSEMRDAWVTSRHVQRVKVVRPCMMHFPVARDYRVVDQKGDFVRFQWERYFGHLLLWTADDFGSVYVDDSNHLSFKRDTLLHQAERAYLASLHWQTWLMHIRQVYMWEDKILTMRWLLTYLFLLKTGFIMTFCYCFVIFIIVRNRYFPTTTTELRWSRERAKDEDKHVLNLSELINRHGNDEWLDPLLDELGPLLQEQLGDLADFLEILFNSYSWSNPRATMHTICLWASCAAVAAFTSAEYGQKVMFWVGGVYFFFSRPIASHYPKYRHLVSIMRWVHWETPTHAELAFQNLRKAAVQNRVQAAEQVEADKQTAEELELPTQSHAENNTIPTFKIDGEARSSIEADEKPFDSHSQVSLVSHESDSSSGGMNGTSNFERYEQLDDIIRFRGRYQSRLGRIIINEDGFRFDTDLPRLRNLHKPYEVLLRCSYDQLLELRKSTTTSDNFSDKVKKRLAPTPNEAIQVFLLDGTEFKIDGMLKRDECFNTIIGFSGKRWQVLEPCHDEEDGSDNGEGPTGGKKLFGNKKNAFGELGKLR